MADEKSKASNRKGYATDYVKSDKDRVQFLGSPMMDNMMTAMTAIAAELWTVKRRLKVHESLLEKHGSITAAMIEQYAPTEEEQKQWLAERDSFARLVYDPFLRPSDLPYDTSISVKSADG